MILSIGSSSWQPVRVEPLARRGVLKHRLEQIGRLILQRMDRVLQGICVVAPADLPPGANDPQFPVSSDLCSITTSNASFVSG